MLRSRQQTWWSCRFEPVDRQRQVLGLVRPNVEAYEGKLLAPDHAAHDDRAGTVLRMPYPLAAPEARLASRVGRLATGAGLSGRLSEQRRLTRRDRSWHRVAEHPDIRRRIVRRVDAEIV